MSFSFRPAVREDVHLMIGISGSTLSGKTWSAMELATGIVGEGNRFAMLDTENGRGLYYADDFSFDHAELGPPFTPERYAEGIKDAAAAGYRCVIVDSASHEHAGEGGLLDWHEAELARMVPDGNWKRRDACSMAAWVKPKMAHARLVEQLLRLKKSCHLIFCFRAAEKIEMVKDKDGKTQIIPKRSPVGLDGWIPIAEKTFPYEMGVSFLLTADKPGVPQPIVPLRGPMRPLVPLDKQLSRDTGARLAAWAAGKSSPPVTKAVEKLKTIAAKAQGEEWQGFLIEQDMKQGTSKRGPWKLYLLRTADNLQFGTFSEGTANELAPYVGSDIAVKIIWSKTPKGGRQIESYEILEP